jgi:hypothetical protein
MVSKLLDLITIPKRCALRIEGGISKGIKGVRQALLLNHAPGKNRDTSHYDNRQPSILGAHEIECSKCAYRWNYTISLAP